MLESVLRIECLCICYENESFIGSLVNRTQFQSFRRNWSACKTQNFEFLSMQPAEKKDLSPELGIVCVW